MRRTHARPGAITPPPATSHPKTPFSRVVCPGMGTVGVGSAFLTLGIGRPLRPAAEGAAGDRGPEPGRWVSGLGEVSGGDPGIWLLRGWAVLFVEAVDHGAGHLGVHLDEHGRLPRWISEGGNRAGLVAAPAA